jgi:subtilisin family serine protease
MEIRAVKLTMATLFAIALSSHASADTITFGGTVAAAPGGTGPAVNNPSLNNIQDDDSYRVTLDFTGSITAPGTYPLPGASLVFSDLNESAGESSFSSVSLSVVTDGAYYDLSILGCLSTGSGCLKGNSLSANFQIPSSDLNSTNVSAHSVPLVYPPLDLLEDDGNTEYQGFVDHYSYQGTTATPEPAAVVPLIMALGAMIWFKQRVGARAR